MDTIDEKTEGKMSRREFIKKIAKGIALFSLFTGSSIAKVFASGEKQITTDIQSARIEAMPDHNMPNGFKRFKITAQYTGQNKYVLVASFFTLENSKSHATFITRSNTKEKKYFEPTINFAKIQQDLAKQGKHVALQIAGAFTPDWKHIEGVAFDEGQNVGEKNPSSWKGFLVIEDGKPRIIHRDDIPDFSKFIQEVQQKKLSIFQQIPIIHNGKIATKPNIPPQKEYEFRFFVERETIHGISRGIVNFTKKMNIDNAIKILQKMETKNPSSKILNALYLDTGSVSQGFFYDKYGNSYQMVDEQFPVKNNGFTNILTFYSK